MAKMCWFIKGLQWLFSMAFIVRVFGDGKLNHFFYTTSLIPRFHEFAFWSAVFLSNTDIAPSKGSKLAFIFWNKLPFSCSSESSLERLGLLLKHQVTFVKGFAGFAMVLYVFLKPIKFYLVSSGHGSLEETDNSGSVVEQLLSGESGEKTTQYIIIAAVILVVVFLILALFSRRMRRRR